MESKADAMKKSGVGGNVNVAVAVPAVAEPAEENESVAVESQEEASAPADVTETADANESAVDGVGYGEPVKSERKKAVRVGCGGRKKG